MGSSKYYAIQKVEKEGKKEADIYIFGDITCYPWDDSDVSGYSLKEELKELDAELIRVHIDCYGGSVSEGWAIYNTLCGHPAKIVSIGEGFVASAALFPFMAGDERIAGELSAFFFHPVSTGAWGYAEDLKRAAEEAEKLTEIGVNMFADKTSMGADEVRELMDNETWLTPKEALEKGIATGIQDYEPENRVQSVRAQVVQLLTKRQEQQALVPEEKEPEPSPRSAFELLKEAFMRQSDR